MLQERGITQGEWFLEEDVEELEIVDSSGRPIASVASTQVHATANAVAIKHVPQLVEALEMAIRLATDRLGDDESSCVIAEKLITLRQKVRDV